MNVFRMEGIQRRTSDIEQYAGPLTTVKVILSAKEQNNTLRLVLRDDLRQFQEVGGDEVRIVDLSEVDPDTLKFGGRYRFEWWWNGALYASFKIDDFDVVSRCSNVETRAS